MEKWQPWQYLLDLLDIINRYHVVYIAKASQVGASWALAIYTVWLANFFETAKCLLISQGQTEAQELLSKVTFVYQQVPDSIKFPLDRNNRESLVFEGNYAEIRALPSTDKAGHGYQATIAVRDEVARHDHAKENFRAIARSGAKRVEVSTANKTEPDNYFREKTYSFWNDIETVKEVLPSGVEIYTNPNQPRTCLVFLSRNIRPVRENGMNPEEWFNTVILPDYTPLEIEEQFPLHIKDIFKESGVMAYFDEESLDQMLLDIREPIKQEEVDTFNGIIRVYKPPIVGRKYVAYTDPSLGVEDPFVTRVKDSFTGERVASAVGKVKVDYAAMIHDYLVRTYNNAWNSFEANGTSGGEFASALRDLNTPNQQMRRDDKEQIRNPYKGLYVTPQLKKVMMERLHFMIFKRHVINHDVEFDRQARMVLRDGGLPFMSRKQSFDWVMADAGLEWIDKFVPRGTVKAETVRDL